MEFIGLRFVGRLEVDNTLPTLKDARAREINREVSHLSISCCISGVGGVQDTGIRLCPGHTQFRKIPRRPDGPHSYA